MKTDGYNYLGILEADRFKNLKMKEDLRKGHFHWMKKILNSKQNSVNVVKVITSKAVAVIRCGTELIKGTEDKLKTIDRKARKAMTIRRAIHSQTDVDRLSTTRNNSERGMISVEDCVEMETEPEEIPVESSNERLLNAMDSQW